MRELAGCIKIPRAGHAHADRHRHQSPPQRDRESGGSTTRPLGKVHHAINTGIRLAIIAPYRITACVEWTLRTGSATWNQESPMIRMYSGTPAMIMVSAPNIPKAASRPGSTG